MIVAVFTACSGLVIAHRSTSWSEQSLLAPEDCHRILSPPRHRGTAGTSVLKKNFQWFGLACVGVLIEDSVNQLLYMFILHAVDLAVLVRASPFANRCCCVVLLV